MKIKFVRNSGTCRVEPVSCQREAKRAAANCSPSPQAPAGYEPSNSTDRSLTNWLHNVQDRNPVIEDFRPLHESLEWTLGQLYWQTTGSGAFLHGKVPFRITNDGNLSRKAAEVLFASLCAAEQDGKLEPTIDVLELGAGLGLFARFFLDAFRELCSRAGADYFERIRYVVADCSPRMLGDLKHHSLLSDHLAHCEFRLADGTKPDFGLGEGLLAGQNGHARQFRAVILNYLVDCFPAAVLRFSDSRVSQLNVRTRLARGLDLRRHTSLTLEQIRGCARSNDPAERERLVSLFRLFALELDYRSVELEKIPFGSTVARHAAGRNGVVLHNFGAIECLERARSLLRPGGFILLNDYDDSPFDEATQSFRHQRFGGATGIGLNVPLLETHFAGREDCEWVAPPGDNRHLCSRLLGCKLSAGTIESFREQFSLAAYDWHFVPIEQARNFLQAGRNESALAAFTQALERQPKNWGLMTEIADFLIFKLRDYPAGLRLTEAAMKLNPLWPDLLNTHGDGLYYLGRMDEAHDAFLRALERNPNDVRSRYNLSFIHRDRHDLAAALGVIAEGLALECRGEYVERLLEQQREILAQLGAQEEELRRCMADRCRMFAGLENNPLPQKSPEDPAGTGSREVDTRNVSDLQTTR